MFGVWNGTLWKGQAVWIDTLSVRDSEDGRISTSETQRHSVIVHRMGPMDESQVETWDNVPYFREASNDIETMSPLV